MKTFVIIMGAGRCGSSGLVSFLNKKPDFHIYGENHNMIGHILNSLNIDFKKIIKENSPCGHKTAINEYNNKNVYNGSEWYNPISKMRDLKRNIHSNIIEYFNHPENYIGFKEIRWATVNMSYLSFFEKHFNVKYIHLIRNTEDQIKSMQRTKWKQKNLEQYLESTNTIIENYLQHKTPSQYITKNISIDKNFQQEIYDFITEQK